MIVFDVLYRLLRHVYGEDHVTYVRNITDVDDKINARALRDFGQQIEKGEITLNEAIAKVTEKTADRFHKDAAALGCLTPTHEPRATAHIDGMVKMIQRLIDKGNAYVTSGREGREVLFSVSSMPDYGKLSNRKLEDQQAGARIAVEDHKRNPADFVLWKESAADEPGWDGSFTEDGASVTIHGRPGWHIECSVMSEHHLGETFDIHGGGLDLIFPHHENEIAQSCCAHGNDRMANLWMHNGFLQVEGKKMSKSDGNFVTIAELLETDKFGGRKWPGEVLRLAMLMTHYREPIDFSVKRLEEALAVLTRWERIATEAAVQPGALDSKFVELLSDDLNTSEAIGRIHELMNLSQWGDPSLPAEANAGVVGFGKGYTGFSEGSERKASVAAGLACANLLGISVVREVEAELTNDVQVQVDRRLELIKAKNWAEADRIRDELLEQGIQLKDGKDPETGERVTTWEVKR